MLRDELFPEESWDDAFLDYREIMLESYEYLSKYRLEFIKDESVDVRFKLERVTEVLDFFQLEGDLEKYKDLQSIKDALDIRFFFIGG